MHRIKRTIPVKVLAFALLLVPALNRAQSFSLGVDLSYVNELQDAGVKYYDEQNIETDPYHLLALKGANLVRLRLWHNPEWTSYSNFADVKRSSERASAEGMTVMLDFHYSDFWADPSRQWRPAAWNDITDDQVLGDSVYQYTYNTLKALVLANLAPGIVQIGNEINGNILIKRTTQKIDDSSPGLFPLDWNRQVFLLHRGIAAVQQINSDYGTGIRTLIHVAQPENALWWFQQGVAAGLTGFDIIGLSYYPQWSDYSVRQLGDAVKFLKEEYNKEVMIVETGYPWTSQNKDFAGNVLGSNSKMPEYGNLISNQVQRDFLIELTWLIEDNGGSGNVYWEPAWVSSSCKTYWATGSHYDNATLFDFSNKINSGADFLSWDYRNQPPGLADQQVVFTVNMTGAETSNGVFITGDFTGKNWTFVRMTESGNQLYVLDTLIPGRSSGAYIYYNKGEWNSAFRETVPSSCAVYWNTHRGYTITNGPAEFRTDFGSCSFSTRSAGSGVPEPGLYPSPATEMITLSAAGMIEGISISNLSGSPVQAEYNSSGELNIAHLHPGLYLLKLSTSEGIFNLKFIKM